MKSSGVKCLVKPRTAAARQRRAIILALNDHWAATIFQKLKTSKNHLYNNAEARVGACAEGLSFSPISPGTTRVFHYPHIILVPFLFQNFRVREEGRGFHKGRNSTEGANGRVKIERLSISGEVCPKRRLVASRGLTWAQVREGPQTPFTWLGR